MVPWNGKHPSGFLASFTGCICHIFSEEYSLSRYAAPAWLVGIHCFYFFPAQKLGIGPFPVKAILDIFNHFFHCRLPKRTGGTRLVQYYPDCFSADGYGKQRQIHFYYSARTRALFWELTKRVTVRPIHLEIILP